MDRMPFKQRLHQVGIAFDQMINAFFGLAHRRGGWADETISARAWREGQKSEKWEIARKGIDLLFFWQDDHCQNAYVSEKERMHLAPEYREF